jgi:hypothetical protein
MWCEYHLNVLGFEEFEIDLGKEFFIIYGKTEGDLKESDEMILYRTR